MRLLSFDDLRERGIPYSRTQLHRLMADQSAIREKVETFDAFAPDNDPYGERDFGAFEHNGNRIFWKIDYYDRASFGTGRDMGSEDPSDPAKTLRVLTIMLASEY